MDNGIFKKLVNGGGYNLPYLLHLYTTDGSTDIHLINDIKDSIYDSITWYASTFKYTPNEDGESSLEVEVVSNDIIDMFENNYNFRAEIVGVLLEDGSVQVIKSYHHKYGTATWDGKSAKITFDKDDRLGMTFPALIFNSYNNRGNSSV